MKKTTKIIYAILMILVIATVSAQNQEKKRVIAHTSEEVSNALAEGCEIARETKTLTALNCPKNTASALNMQEDIRMFALDMKSNTQIQANTVHSAGNTGQGRKIVILDTGYNYNHKELNSSYLGGKDFVNDDNDPFDDNGHGSHVAGIITADGIDANAKGVAPATGIITGKVLDNTGSGFFSDIVAAIYWAVDGEDGIAQTADDFNADAISMSIGTAQPYTYKKFCDSTVPDMANAISYARARNTAVVVAAGNSGSAGVSIPGCISHSITIGAVDGTDKISSFSGRGKAVDISAPGVSIYSTWLGETYLQASGTSMATPIASGTIALIKTTHPEYTVNQIENALFKTAKDMGKISWDTSYGWGRINAYEATK